MRQAGKNCRICGVELNGSNVFTCRRCGSSDVCIIHKGPASDLCAFCLTSLKRRIVFSIFILVSLIMILFSPVIFASVTPILVFVFMFYLSFWLFLESSRPVITRKRLKSTAENVMVITVFFFFLLIIGWNMLLKDKPIDAPDGFSSSIFLISGVLLVAMGFIFLFALSVRSFGISLFDYDYPEEYSILLRKATGDPEKVAVLRWDIRLTMSVAFIFGLLFLYIYAQISSTL